METDIILILLGVILTAISSQTIAVWVKFGNLEKKMNENRCPFGKCPMFERAKEEAVKERHLEN